MKMSNLSSFCFLVLLLTGFSSTVFAQRGELKERFTQVQKIKFDVAVGSIEFRKSDSGATTLEGDYDSGKLDVEVSFKNGQLKVIEKTKRRNSGSVASKYLVMIPDGLSIDLNSGTGHMKFNSIEADVHLNTGTGNIEFVRFKGDVNSNTGTGDVALRNCSGEMTLNSGTGDVLVDKCEGGFNLNSGTGNVRVDGLRGKVSANSGTGNVLATGVQLEGNGSFNSGTGNVKLTLSHPLTNDLYVNSGTGSASLDMNRQSFDGTLVMACNEKGGRINAPFDFDKKETEDKTIRKYKYFGDSSVQLRVSTGTGNASVKK